MQHLNEAQLAVVAESTRSQSRNATLEHTWVLWSDDDDISHPDRVAAYAEVVQQTEAMEAQERAKGHTARRSVAGIICTRVAMRRENKLAAAGAMASHGIECPADVDSALRVGAADVRDFNEYWCYCVRLSAVRQFFASTPPKLLANRLADLRFRQWLSASGPMPFVEKVLGPRAPPWAYFYDRDNQSHQHAHRTHDASVRQIDQERAHRLSAGLPPGMDGDLPLSLLEQMREVGEMGTVIGFDGPKLGVRLPRARRTREIRSLLIEALQHPVDHWRLMPPPVQQRFHAVAEELGEELLQLAESFVD